MVQIIQSGPSAATLRQQALDQAFGNIMQGYSNYDQQQKQEALTKRQEALRSLDKTLDLRSQGYDVTPDQVNGLYSNPEAGLGNIFDKRTAEYSAKIERENQKALKEQEKFQADLEKTKAEIAKIGRVDPLDGLRADELRQRVRLGKAQEQKLGAETEKFKRETIQGKPATEPQLKAAGFATRARQAANELKAMPADVGTGEILDSIQGAKLPILDIGFPEAFKGNQRKQFEQTERNFISAVLRPESGAAISNEEYENEGRKYFPRPGDSPEVLAQKDQAREQAIANLEAQAGNGLSNIRKVGAVPSFEEWKAAKGI